MSSAVKEDKEVHILLDDQQRINRFARLNSRWEDLREEVKAKREEVKTLEDAQTDLMMLEDDEERVPFQVGEVFLLMSQDDAQAEIDRKKARLEDEAKELSARMDVLKAQMSDLKTHLYAKFGSAINLEADEEG